MSRRHVVESGILLSLLALAPAVPAAAEVIAINSGRLSFGTGVTSQRLVISGTRDFRFQGSTLTGINEPDGADGTSWVARSAELEFRPVRR